jgi:hypothetical protein
MSEATVETPFVPAERAPQKASFDARSEGTPTIPSN